MNTTESRPRRGLGGLVALGLCLGTAATSPAKSDEAAARQILQSMSDYLADQKDLSFDYDAVLQVVTTDGQTLGVAASGDLALQRPDHIRATRHGGFVDVEMLFDGKTLTVFGKNENAYTQVDVPGDVNNLVDVLREKYGLPLPAADLITADPYNALMVDVSDVKDLGSGMVGNVECNSLAFRSSEVDFQIWVAQGDHPYPCKFVITTRGVKYSPQYTLDIHNWHAGGQAQKADFKFQNATAAKKVDIETIRAAASDLPSNFTSGGK